MRIICGAILVCLAAAAQENFAVRPPACSCTSQVLSYAAGNEPACNVASRGGMVVSLGGSGQPDLVKTCMRDGAGRYSWTAVAQQNPHTFVNSRKVGNCPVFPDDNVWNSRVDSLPVDPESAGIIATFAVNRVGTEPSMAINLADSSTSAFRVGFDARTDSDGGSYPLAGNMSVEGYLFNTSFPVSGGPYKSDAHVLVMRTDECKLYEIYLLENATPPYRAGSGATFDLLSNDLRTDGFTSADAAGLPIWPGVLTYDEVYGNAAIQHMVRFTLSPTRNSYIWPARHYASSNGSASVPPMGSRWRLKASFDETTCAAFDNTGQKFPPEAQRIIRALKQYGMILADNGSSILITTDSDPRWGDPNSPNSPNWSINGWTHCIRGSDFEVVDTSTLMASPSSAAVAK
jgi:hypothetical protein